MIYSKDGTELTAVYSKNGNPLTAAYSKSGEQIFPDGHQGLIHLKVMTYNVGQWYIGNGDNVPADLDEVFFHLQNEMLHLNDTDILFIEEYWKIFSNTGRTAISLLQTWFPYIYEQGGTSGYYGRCICSKYPISNYTVHTYSDNANRYYDSCLVNVGETEITLIVTHLDAQSGDKRIAEATELCNFVKSLSGWFIIGGDFNTTIVSPFSEENAAVYNQFLNYGCSLANGGDFGILKTYRNGTDWGDASKALDNIICSPGITIESVSTDLTKTTDADVLATGKIDHIPLIAVAEIPR